MKSVSVMAYVCVLCMNGIITYAACPSNQNIQLCTLIQMALCGAVGLPFLAHFRGCRYRFPPFTTLNVCPPYSGASY